MNRTEAVTQITLALLAKAQPMNTEQQTDYAIETYKKVYETVAEASTISTSPEE